MLLERSIIIFTTTTADACAIRTISGDDAAPYHDVATVHLVAATDAMTS